MPLIFPSHQGLILPVWKRFPGLFDPVALCVGAAMPDVVDAVAWPLRGELGQWLGHSLLGVAFSVPFGVALARVAGPCLPRRWVARLLPPATPAPKLTRAGLSVALGALSHVASDLATHGNFVLLWPWYRNDHAFPSWWYHSWGGIPLPVYREPYPIAPHLIAWLIVSALGAVLFVRCVGRQRSP